MPATLLGHFVGESPDGNPFTTGPFDTTGATLIVVVQTFYAPSSATLTDNKGNTYTRLTPRTQAQGGVIWYKFAPNVGTGHTWSYAGVYGVLFILPFTGVLSFEAENGAITTGGQLSVQTGSVTPAEDNELIISGYAINTSGSATTEVINSGFTVLDHRNHNGAHFGGAVAVRFNGSGTAGVAINPTWTANVAVEMCVTIASFRTVPPIIKELSGEVELADTSVLLTWVEFTDKTSVVRVWSKTDLADAATYYQGFKEARVISWGRIARALSDREGQFEATDFSWVLSDTDRSIRGLLGASATQYFKNRPVVVRMIDDEARRRQLTPRTLIRGYITDYKPMSPLHFQFAAKDMLTTKFAGFGTTEAQVPQRIWATDFPGSPLESRLKRVPIIYGKMSDESSSSSGAVHPDVYGPEGSYSQDIYYSAGFGPTASVAAVPTGVGVSYFSGALSDDVPNSEYGVWVTAIDSSGRESDPHIYYANGPGEGRGSWAVGPTPGTVVNGSQGLRVIWSASSGAVKYRAYLGYYYYGARWVQFIETTDLFANFTAAAPWQEAATLDNITPGAQLVNYAPFYYYAVIARMADGFTAPSSPDIYIAAGPYVRPIRIRWLGVVGALDYRVIRRPFPSTAGPVADGWGGWDRSWTAAAGHADVHGLFFDDDMHDTGVTYLTSEFSAPTGIVPVTYLGPTPDDFGTPWETFGICGHAVKKVEAWFLGGRRVDTGTAGVTWLVPGWAGYNTYFSASAVNGLYRDINGRRYALLYVRGPDGTSAAGSDPDTPQQAITLNVLGIETVGDGSGTLITGIIQQYQHVLLNWVLRQYQVGGWFEVPTFEDDPTLGQVDTASFVTADSLAGVRLPGAYVGAGIIGFNGEAVSVRDLVAQFNISCDVDCGFNRRGQFFISMLDDHVMAFAAAQTIDDVNDVIEGTFDVADALDAHVNTLPFSFRETYSGQQPPVLRSIEDAASIANYTSGSLSGRMTGPLLELKFVRDELTAADIAQRRLNRQKHPPRIARFSVPITTGMNLDLGTLLLLTHYGGIGEFGWSKRKLRVIRHETDPEGLSVALECYDMGKWDAYEMAVRIDGVSHWWRLNETSGLTAVDAIFAGSNGVISGGVTLGVPTGASGAGGTAMRFNGTTGKIVAGPITLPTVYTVEAWVSITGVLSQNPFFSTRGYSGTGVYIGFTGNRIFSFAGGGAVGLTTLSTGQWYHVVVVITPTSVLFYLNGVADGTGLASADTSGAFTNAAIAWDSINVGEFFAGGLDEIAVYPLALTPSQIANHYALGKPLRTYVNTVVADGASHYWRLGESSGSIAVDFIGGANGVIQGGVTFGASGPLADGSTAMTFDGTTGRIIAPASVLDCGNPAQSFSIEFWINGRVYTTTTFCPVNKGATPANTGGRGWDVMYGTKDYWFFGRTSNGACARVEWGSLVSLPTPIAGQWFHTVVTYNATTHLVTVYLNGVSIKTQTLGNSGGGTVNGDIAAYTDTFPLEIGRGSLGYTDGNLAEVALYPLVLTPARVSDHFALRTAR